MRLEGKAGQSRFLLILCHVMLYAVVMVPSFTYRNITTSIYKRKVETLLRRGLSLLFFLIHTCLLCMYKMHKHIKHKYTNLYILEKKKGKKPSSAAGHHTLHGWFHCGAGTSSLSTVWISPTATRNLHHYVTATRDS